jgi:hypothetical protein
MKLRWIIIGGTLLFSIPKTRKIILNIISDLLEKQSETKMSEEHELAGK